MATEIRYRRPDSAPNLQYYAQASGSAIPASRAQEDTIEFVAENPCKRYCEGFMWALRSLWDCLFRTAATLAAVSIEVDAAIATPVTAEAEADIATPVDDRSLVASYVSMCHQDAPYLIRNFPSLPQEFKDYVYANLYTKGKNLMQWKRDEGMHDNNEIFTFLLQKGYIQEYDELYKTFTAYLER